MLLWHPGHPPEPSPGQVPHDVKPVAPRPTLAAAHSVQLDAPPASWALHRPHGTGHRKNNIFVVSANVHGGDRGASALHTMHAMQEGRRKKEEEEEEEEE